MEKQPFTRASRSCVAEARLTISPAETEADFDAVRELCWEYRAFLLTNGEEARRIVETFYPEAAYAALMSDLSGAHAPPDGRVLVARLGDEPVGCGMFKRIGPDAAEIKRVYLRPSARGLGGGRKMMLALTEAARESGYARIFMDTGKPLQRAIDLYFNLGFRLRGPYQPVPEIARGHMVFFEMEL